MTKKIFLSLFIVLIATYIVIKWHSKNATPATDAIWVKAAAVKEVTLPLKVEVIGTLVGRSVEITPELPGHVEKILFKDGAFVKEGEPLIQLDDAIYRAKNTSASAKYNYNKNNYARMVILGKRGAIAKQAIDQSEAELKQTKADADEAEVLLNKMTLSAPFAGVVGKSRVNPGDYVTVGMSLVTLTDTKHLHIEYNVPEKFLPLLKLNQAVFITASAYPSQKFRGTVAFISPTVSPENRSVSLYAEVPNNEGKLAAGMFVNVTQDLDKEEHVLMIPARSVVPILDAEQVYKIVDGKAVAVTVILGKRVDNDVQVLQGLRKKDVIVTDGQLKIKNGASVQYTS